MRGEGRERRGEGRKRREGGKKRRGEWRERAAPFPPPQNSQKLPKFVTKKRKFGQGFCSNMAKI